MNTYSLVPAPLCKGAGTNEKATYLDNICSMEEPWLKARTNDNVIIELEGGRHSIICGWWM